MMMEGKVNRRKVLKAIGLGAGVFSIGGLTGCSTQKFLGETIGEGKNHVKALNSSKQPPVRLASKSERDRILKGLRAISFYQQVLRQLREMGYGVLEENGHILFNEVTRRTHIFLATVSLEAEAGSHTCSILYFEGPTRSLVNTNTTLSRGETVPLDCQIPMIAEFLELGGIGKAAEFLGNPMNICF